MGPSTLVTRLKSDEVRVSARVFAVILAVGSLGACTEQDTVPLDLDGTVPLVEPPVHSDTGNDEARAEGRRLAENMCLEDASLEQGVVQIANPDTGIVVAEIVVDCAEVR